MNEPQDKRRRELHDQLQAILNELETLDGRALPTVEFTVEGG